MSNFTHLHVHSQYSILDGAVPIKGLIAKALEYGMTAVAITDHGNLFGVKEFWDAAKKAKIKPIIGCEVYVANNSRFDKDKNDKDDRSGNHLILLAKNFTGYGNLIKLVSLGYTEGFYYKPRIDKTLLEQYHEGLIVSTACLAGEIPDAIRNGNMQRAENAVLFFKNLFGEDFYFELMRHFTGNPEIDNDVFESQEKVNAVLLELSSKYGIKCIATNDVHFVNADDAEAHDILICLNTNSEVDDKDRMRYTRQEYFKSPQQMSELFADIPEAITNTQEIVDKIEEYNLNSRPIMPYFQIPEGYADEDEYLRHLTYKGAQDRYGEISDTIKERIEFELAQIKRMGFPGYFLIVQDFLHEARKMGVTVGPGRGSAAGSVVAYCNYITDVDPIKYGLLFERFLNLERISLPDIDIDFDEDGREKVLDYVVRKYGENRVAHIVTFGTMAAKMAIRDVARVLKLQLSEADRLTKLVPDGTNVSLKKSDKEGDLCAYDVSYELAAERNSANPLVVKTLKYAETLEGSIRQSGIHACGIIISRNDLTDKIPVFKQKDTKLLITQFEGKYVESVGMLKMDFLGLKTLSIIVDTLANIKASRGIDVDIKNIPLDDKKTFALYSRGDTTAIFQFESPGMKKYLRELKPNRFEDLIAMNALYRPGPMEFINNYIRRKHGKEKISYVIPPMEPYLKETYGITVYQEQVMQLSQVLAGFTAGQADSLRKAMGKKKKEVMDEMRSLFFEGCKNNGYQEATVSKIWEEWEAFAQYAFNKSHSTCYAYLSYQTAYLKAHYTAEFMAAVLSRNLNDIKKITDFLDECRRLGIEVLGPDINESHYRFMVNSDGNIRFGLGGIKGLGEAAVEKIIEERERNGQYTSVYNFFERINLQAVNKKSIEALVYAGALDGFSEVQRYQYFLVDEKGNSVIEMLLRYGNRYQTEICKKGNSLFGDTQQHIIVKPTIPIGEEWTTLQKLNLEKEVIGIYLSAHPLDEYAFEMKAMCNTTLAGMHNIPPMETGKELIFAGIVTEARHASTKNGKPFGSITLEDYSDTYRITFFANDYITYKNYITKGYSLLIKGKYQKRGWGDNKEELEFKVKEISLLSAVRENMVKSLSIKIPLPDLSESLIEDIMNMSNEKKGKVLLKFTVWDPDENIAIDMFSRTRRLDMDDKVVHYLLTNELQYKVN